MLRRSAPPPERTIPLSITSEASSGGVSSRTLFTAAMICWSTGSIASVISFEPMVIVRERYHRRLGEDDALAANVDDDVGRAEVDADLTCEHRDDSKRSCREKVAFLLGADRAEDE